MENDKLVKIKQDLQSKYVFTVDYRKESGHGVPDALSRNPVNDPDKYGYNHIDFWKILAINGTLGIKDLNIKKSEFLDREPEIKRILGFTSMSKFTKYLLLVRFF